MSTRRVLLRLTLVTGGAAVGALSVRGFIADRVAQRFSPFTQALAARVPSTPYEPPSPAPPLPPMHVPDPVASQVNPNPAPKKLASLPAKSPLSSAKETGAKHAPHVTRAEVEQAIATKLGGASAKLARDGEGKPLGLVIQSVGSGGRFGVQPGDVLVAANGLPLRTAEEGFAALGAIFPDGGKSPSGPTHVVFTFKRGGGYYSVPIDVEAP